MGEALVWESHLLSLFSIKVSLMLEQKKITISNIRDFYLLIKKRNVTQFLTKQHKIKAKAISSTF
jgi:hypothetical protein